MKILIRFKLEKFYLFLILLVGLMIRVYQLTPVMLERVSNRQIIAANLTRGLYHRGLVDIQTHLFGFPVYHWIVGGFYSLFGGVNEIWGRLVSVGMSVLAGYFFYKLVLLGNSKRRALLATFFFYLMSPVHIIMSRSFLIDETTLFLGVSGLYFLALWQKKGKPLGLVMGTVLVSLTFLSKFLFGYLVLPAIYLFRKSGNKKSGVNWKGLAIFLLVTLLPVTVWSLYTKVANEQLNGGPTGEWNVFYIFSPRLLLNPKYYVNIFYHFSKHATTYVGVPLVLLGMSLKSNLKKASMYFLWLIGALGFILLFNNPSFTHTYYFLAFSAPAAYFAAVAVEHLAISLGRSKYVIPRFWLMLLFGLLAISTNVTDQFMKDYKSYPRYQNIPLVARVIENLTTEDEFIVSSAYSFDGIRYFSHRDGIELRLSAMDSSEAISQLEKNINSGATHYVLYDKKELAGKEGFAKHLKDYKLIFEHPDLDTLIYLL